MTDTKPKILTVSGAVVGKTYRVRKGIFTRTQPLLVLWRIAPDRVAYLYSAEIDSIIPVAYDYLVEDFDGPMEPYEEFDRKMKIKYQRDFPQKAVFWQDKPVAAAKTKVVKPEIKENKPMAEVPAPAAKPQSKKERRALLNAEIKTWKDEREALSNANAELKKKAASVESREEKRTLNDQVKANVEKRAQLSESIKANVEKVKALRAE